jgi:hypothetical protein
VVWWGYSTDSMQKITKWRTWIGTQLCWLWSSVFHIVPFSTSPYPSPPSTFQSCSHMREGKDKEASCCLCTQLWTTEGFELMIYFLIKSGTDSLYSKWNINLTLGLVTTWSLCWPCVFDTDTFVGLQATHQRPSNAFKMPQWLWMTMKLRRGHMS